MTSVQVLAAAGLLSGITTVAGGIFSSFHLIALGSAIMFGGNVYAFIQKE